MRAPGPKEGTPGFAWAVCRPIPVLSVAVGGGEVLLEVSVSSEGSVIEVKPLRSTASFDELMIGVVRGWQFAPAER